MAINLEDLLDLLENNPELSKKIYEKLRDKFATIEQFQIILEELRKSREESNLRFEKMDQRFEKMDQRFEKMDQRFEKMDRRITEIQSGLGINFEGYNKNVLMNFLEAQGVPAKNMVWRAKIPDPEHRIHKKSTEVEIDLFLSDPLIIVEVTSIEGSFEKVDKFVQIIKWLEKKYDKDSTSYYLLYDFEEEIREKATSHLLKHNVKIISTQT